MFVLCLCCWNENAAEYITLDLGGGTHNGWVCGPVTEEGDPLCYLTDALDAYGDGSQVASWPLTVVPDPALCCLIL